MANRHRSNFKFTTSELYASFSSITNITTVGFCSTGYIMKKSTNSNEAMKISQEINS